MVQFQSEGRRPMSQLNSQAGRVPSFSAIVSSVNQVSPLHTHAHTHTHTHTHIQGRANCFISILIQVLISSRITLIDTTRIMFDQVSGYPSCWHPKLSITLSYPLLSSNNITPTSHSPSLNPLSLSLFLLVSDSDGNSSQLPLVYNVF